jgi:RNA polymerase sigma factor (sigma-70 family)
MTEPDDIELLREFAENNSDAAFATLVARHVNLVYSTALRSTGNSHSAEEITQAVFIILARKAKKISRKTILTGWLHQTTRLTAANFLRTEIRRQHREQEAFMQSAFSETETWTQIAPLLDDAISKLGGRDRDAILLRYFENKSAREMAAALRVDEPAAQKRVTRAVEKLRAFFAKRGVTLTAAAIAGAVSANSVQAAPIGLAATVTAAAAKGAAVSASTLTLIKGALKIMAWTKIKIAIVVGAGVLLVAGTTEITIKEIQDYPWRVQNPDYKLLEQLPPSFKILPTKFSIANTIGSSDGRDVKRIGIDVSVENLVYDANEFFGPNRTVCLTPWPAGKYDFIDTLPKANEVLKQAIKEKFGIVARLEMIETNVFLLAIKNPNAPGLKPSGATSNSLNEDIAPHSGEYACAFGDIFGLAGFCEGQLGIPVLDRTGNTNKYDIDLKWQWKDGESEKEVFKKAVLDQLGLEFVPTNMPIEMLVVEKVKN